MINSSGLRHVGFLGSCSVVVSLSTDDRILVYRWSHLFGSSEEQTDEQIILSDQWVQGMNRPLLFVSGEERRMKRQFLSVCDGKQERNVTFLTKRFHKRGKIPSISLCNKSFTNRGGLRKIKPASCSSVGQDCVRYIYKKCAKRYENSCA